MEFEEWKQLTLQERSEYDFTYGKSIVKFPLIKYIFLPAYLLTVLFLLFFIFLAVSTPSYYQEVIVGDAFVNIGIITHWVYLMFPICFIIDLLFMVHSFWTRSTWMDKVLNKKKQEREEEESKEAEE